MSISTHSDDGRGGGGGASGSRSPPRGGRPSPVKAAPRREVLFAPPEPRKEQVEAYVDAILRDPSMNLKGIPDNIEKTIYTIGITMALSACYKVIFSVNGKMILGHHVELEIKEGKVPSPPSRIIGDQLNRIEELVDELLLEELINITWLPDCYEKPLYVNVISAVFTVMESFFAAAKVDFLGQSLEVLMRPQDASANMGARRLAQKVANVRRVSEEVLEDELDEHFKRHNSEWIPDSIERPMFKTIYALVLCITDEVFRDMRVDCLGDEVMFHLVPGPMQWPGGSEGAALAAAEAAAGAARAGQSGAAVAAAAVEYGQHELILAALMGALVGAGLFR